MRRRFSNQHHGAPLANGNCSSTGGHAASLMPIKLHPLLRWRMEEVQQSERDHARIAKLERRRPGFVNSVLQEVRDRGPISARELSNAGPRRGPWWGWSDGKLAMEWIFDTGRVTTAHRRGFERVYDLPDRVLPAHILSAPTPSREDAQRSLLSTASRALGVATEKDLCDYFRVALIPGAGESGNWSM